MSRHDGLMRDVLAAWGELTIVGPLGGGHRNSVLELWRDGRRLVARQSRRPALSLDWELDLLAFLARKGFRVPTTVATADGRRHVRGIVVQSWLDGSPPGPDDWAAVAAELRRLHGLTAGWPQRPGFASTRELLTANRGGDVDLTAMPAAAVADCRRAWQRLASAGHREAVVHGDPGPANIRMSGGRVGLLDWDEARVDQPDLDLADLPGPAVADLEGDCLVTTRAAVRAWETAAGWLIEPSYARRQLALLRAAAAS
jgi:Ser/Thr protein kinase RdoA (MazF antagonist)